MVFEKDLNGIIHRIYMGIENEIELDLMGLHRQK
jgi:hypothetical protein